MWKKNLLPSLFKHQFLELRTIKEGIVSRIGLSILKKILAEVDLSPQTHSGPQNTHKTLSWSWLWSPYIWTWHTHLTCITSTGVGLPLPMSKAKNSGCLLLSSLLSITISRTSELDHLFPGLEIVGDNHFRKASPFLTLHTNISKAGRPRMV